ncbi:MAG: hypothetical protein AAGI01_01220 [Myxococcota bacterium]
MHRRRWWMAGALGVAVALCACEQPNWEDPAYIGEKLLSADANEVTIAVERARELDQEKRKALVEPLSKLYLKADLSQKDAMALLVQLKDPGAKDAYIAEVKTNATKYGGAAAEALGQAGVKEALGDMLALLDSTDDPDVKVGILRGMSYMPDKQMVGALTKLLRLNPDNNPIALHSYACDILGDIAIADPSAVNDAAVQEVVKGVFLSNNQMQTTAKECGLAVQKIGAPAIPVLLATFKGENMQVQKLMMAYQAGITPKQGVADMFPMNRPRGVAAVRLATMRAQVAVPEFIKLLEEPVELPKELKGATGESKLGWVQMQAQVFTEVIRGLGDMRAKEATDILLQIASGEKMKDYSLIVDGFIEMQMRQDAVAALNKIGERGVADKIFEIATSAKVDDLITRFDYVDGQAKQGKGKPVDAQTRFNINFVMMQGWVNLAGPGSRAKYDSWVSSLEREDYKTLMGKLTPALEVAEECGAKSSQGEQASCYAGKVKSGEDASREKAAYELSRLSTADAGAAVFDALGTDRLATREVLTFSAYQHAAHKGAAQAVDAILERDASQGGDGYKLDRYRLKLLHAFLVRQAAG